MSTLISLWSNSYQRTKMRVLELDWVEVIEAQLGLSWLGKVGAGLVVCEMGGGGSIGAIFS